jgi:3',5'-cyclic AMP phosphodiesterase CpdA
VDALVADVAAARPDATILTGDLTMRARAGEFARARELIERLPSPHLVVLGNHDIPLYDVVARFTDPYGRYGQGVRADLDPIVDVEGGRVLGLQSMPRWRWKSGRVSHRQTELVGTVLSSAPAGALRVLALHHPPSLGGLERLKGRDRLRAAMADAGVDVVLAGHTHVPEVRSLQVVGATAERSVLEVVCGTSASMRTRGVPATWMLLRADESQIRVLPRMHTGSEWVDGPDVVEARQPHGRD